MKKYKPQHARLIFIDRKIREQRFPNCSSLAQEWEVSSKTIQRDLEYLRDCLNAPLVYSPQHRGYYYTEPNYHLPALHLKESEISALFLTEKLLAQYRGTPLHEQLRCIFQKIEATLPQKEHDWDAQLERFTVFPPSSTVIDSEVLTTAFACLRSSTSMEIEYARPGQQAIWRRIDPYHALRCQGDWYIVGHCHLRGEIRSFSLARVRSICKGQEQFSVPTDFDFESFSASHFGAHFGGPETEVSLAFDAEVAAYVRERQWHPSQILEEQADGSLMMRLRVTHVLELKRWVLSWGDAARVCAPASLAEEIGAIAGRMVKHYHAG